MRGNDAQRWKRWKKMKKVRSRLQRRVMPVMFLLFSDLSLILSGTEKLGRLGATGEWLLRRVSSCRQTATGLRDD